MRGALRIIGLATGMALVLGLGFAWTQVRQEAGQDSGRGSGRDSGQDSGPVPSEVTLNPSREQAGARAAALKDPLGERLRRGMIQDPRARSVLAQIQDSPVPVLAPPDPALLNAAVFVAGDRHYMLVVERDGQVIEIYGSIKAFRSPHARVDTPSAPPPTAARRRPVVSAAALAEAQARGLSDIRVEPTEYGTDVSFSRFGAVYNVSFLCEGPGTPGCTPPEALAFAAELRLIGGGER